MDPERKHLRRLDQVWQSSPIYFVTTCVAGRAGLLANDDFHSIAVSVWQKSEELYGWAVGRYVIMPDHVHFFASNRRETHSLSHFIGKWKEWTAKTSSKQLEFSTPLWQPEFFDHILRSSESYEQKWDYVRGNPVRAGLVAAVGDWKFQGTLTELKYD
jgi:putative transposase